MGRLNIAILDDNKTDSAIVQQFVFRFFGEENCRLNCFDNTNAFLSALSEEHYDIAFLDIVLDDENGIQVGEAVNERAPDTDIVFISSYPEYFQDVYKARHSWFLTKPLDWDRFSEAMTRISVRAEKGTVGIQTRQGMERIPYHNILYLESYLKHTVFHMKDGSKAEFSVQMGEVEKQLPNMMFVRVHKSYIINVRYIVKYNSRQVEMEGGESIPISRSYASSAREKLTRILAGELR